MSNARPKSLPLDHPVAVEFRVLGGFAVVADGQALPERAWGGSRSRRGTASTATRRSTPSGPISPPSPPPAPAPTTRRRWRTTLATCSPRYYRDCLTRRRELGNWRDLALSLEQIATLAADLGDYRRAVALIGAASIIRHEQSIPRTERARALSEPILAGARVALVNATFAAAEAECEVWTADEAAVQALAYLAE